MALYGLPFKKTQKTLIENKYKHSQLNLKTVILFCKQICVT